MAGHTKSEYTKAISDLADGFTSLEEEFQLLASQHSSLKRHVSAITEQCQALKHLIPNTSTLPKLLEGLSEAPPSDTTAGRPVVDWLGDLRGSTDLEAQKSIARIRDAEFACFKIREKLKQRESGLDSAQGLVPLRRRDGRVSFNDIEQDHTIARTPGELGCPFARAGGAKVGPPPPYVRSHDIPTPRSSGSQVGLIKARSRSQRPSLHDPIRPEIEAPSEVSDQGPACPIRFLDRHTPEDVAKYFEEHKHELPRSHEFCVKRFQTNSESIRELDAKYGNLVNMIQGLGQKHQPMLPSAPKSTDAAITDDSKSVQRVRNWAQDVSEGDPGDEPTPDETTGGDEGERLGRFDRPLKEIRVGESPSRPWGVSIPSKYLDKVEEPDSAGAAPSKLDNPAPAKGLDIAPDPVQKKEAVERPKLKCPFGHGATTAPTQAAAPKAAPVNAELEHLDQISALQKAFGAKKSPVQPPVQTASSEAVIVNHGLAFIASYGGLSCTKIENRGTLVIGYSSTEAQSIQREYEALHR